MEEQDSEKTGKTTRKIITECSSSSSKATSLPLDLIFGILLRLPAKSVVKFRCVSKLWSSVTTLPSFIKSFATRSSSTTSPCLLILSQNCDKLFVFSIPQNQNSDKPVHSYEMSTRPKTSGFACIESVNGLICLTRPGTVAIWNPTTRSISTLPKPERVCWRPTKGFLGFDPIDGIYKVLCTPTFRCRSHKGSNQPRVLTLGGSQDTWRVIQDITQHYPLGHGQCINGVVYYLASFKLYGTDVFLVSFHVRSEKMSMINVPWTWDQFRGFLFPYQGKLAFVALNLDDISMWILEDAANLEWSYKHLHLPFRHNDPISQTFLRLSGVNEAGEFIYVPYELVNPLEIIYFDPETNNFRKDIVEGVVDDQFRRHNGLGDDVPLYTLSTCSNHIETLMSCFCKT